MKILHLAHDHPLASGVVVLLAIMALDMFVKSRKYK